MFLTFLIGSSLMVITSNSWMAIWVALEMNTLAFCSLFFIKKMYKKKNLENNLKYFIVQSTASAILIIFMSMTTSYPSSTLLMAGGTMAILVKLAAAPFHSWFIEVMKSTSASNSSLLLTWQKLAPTFILIYLMKMLILISLVASGIMGVISQMNQKKLKEIMAISSVFNMSWVLMAALSSIKILVQFLFLYWMSVLAVMYIMWKTQFTEKSDDNPEMEMNLTSMILLVNLAGIPPTSGFLAKWMVVTYSLSQKMVTITSFLLIISSINLYIYLRTFAPMIIKSFKKTQKEKNSLSKSSSMISLILPSLMIISSLDHAWT